MPGCDFDYLAPGYTSRCRDRGMGKGRPLEAVHGRGAYREGGRGQHSLGTFGAPTRAELAAWFDARLA